MNRLLSEDVPLRTTQMLGDFAETVPLPHRYGRLLDAPFRLIRLSPTKYLVADHPMTITQVFYLKVETHDWNAKLESDDEGHTWQVIEFGSAIPDTASETDVTACGYGKLNPRTGKLLENPADIMEDVLRLSGRTETFGQLRAEASAAGLTLGGSITEIKSIRATLDEIAFSAGAVWTVLGARLYPVITVIPPITALNKMNAGNLHVSCALKDTADILRLYYDVSEATGRPLQYIELTASPQLYGGLSQEVTLPWLRTPVNAEAVGRRWLHRLAGNRRDVTYDSELVDLRPGDWTTLSHPAWPIAGADPTLMTLAVDVTPDTGTVNVVAEAVLSAPVIKVTGHSVAAPTGTSAGVEVNYRNGIVFLRFLDDSEKPIKDASISFDLGAPKKTNEQGRVDFVAGLGEHQIDFDAVGYQSFTMSVVL